MLIVDWDVHHGQGVQYCFEEDPRSDVLTSLILYIILNLPCRTKQIKENRFVWPSTIYTWMPFVYFSVCSTSLGTAMSTRAFGLIFKNQIMTMWEREKEPDLISMYRGIRQASYHIKHPQSIIQTVLHYESFCFFNGWVGAFLSFCLPDLYHKCPELTDLLCRWE